MAQQVVAFDKDNQAAVYIHKHGDGDDHSHCGPVVTCCERASEHYRRLAPELHSTVDRFEAQSGQHLASWLDNGVGTSSPSVTPDSDPSDLSIWFTRRPCSQIALGAGQPRALFP